MTADLRQVEQADVYKAGALAARLTRTPDGIVFAYLPDWTGPAVATTLPTEAGPVLRPGGALPAFFTGLLPEGRRLSALRTELKTSADDELTLLLGVGADAVGDVQVVPAGTPVHPIAPRVEFTDDVSDVSFRDLLKELGIRAERVALPGVQDKVSAAMLTLPVARQGDRFLLKLNPPEFPHLVENEACFLEAARHSGLDVVDARVVHDRTGQNGLLVRRFDRDGESFRAVEDGCQVLGRPPADKYRLSTEDVFAGLAGVCQAPLPALRTLLSQLVFAYLTGNGDAHAKNFSIVQTNTAEWRVAPAYDLPSSQPYGDTTLALTIGGRTVTDAGPATFLDLAADLGLREAAARRVLTTHVERVDAWLPLLDALPFDLAKRRKLAKVVTYRRDRLATRR